MGKRKQDSLGDQGSEAFHKLKISPEVPRHPLANCSFPLNVFLLQPDDVPKEGWRTRILVEVLYEEGKVVQDQGMLQVWEGGPVPEGDEEEPSAASALTKVTWACCADRVATVGEEGSVRLRIAVNQLSIVHENKNFFLRVSCTEEGRMAVVCATTSTIMTVVKQRLVVTANPPEIWFKDEGGRGLTFSVDGVLCDAHGQTVASRGDFPLTVRLVYESGQEVANQAILHIANEGKVRVQKGKFSVHCRIDEVSKNHQKQAFRIRVSPDIGFSVALADIAPISSRPVLVRSKRTKQQQQQQQVVQPPQHKPVPSLVASRAAPPPSAPAVLSEPPSPESTPPPIHVHQQTPSVSTSSTTLLPSKRLRSDATLAPRDILSVHAPTDFDSSRAPSASPSPHPSGLQSAAPTPPIHSLPLPPPSTPPDSALDSKLLASLEHEGLSGAALHDVIRWCQFCERSMRDWEWQTVGFLDLGDDVPGTCPLSRCPACWVYKDNIRPTPHLKDCALAACLQNYRQCVVRLFQDLVLLVNATSACPRCSQVQHALRAGDGPSPTVQLPPPATSSMHADGCAVPTGASGTCSCAVRDAAGAPAGFASLAMPQLVPSLSTAPNLSHVPLPLPPEREISSITALTALGSMLPSTREQSIARPPLLQLEQQQQQQQPPLSSTSAVASSSSSSLPSSSSISSLSSSSRAAVAAPPSSVPTPPGVAISFSALSGRVPEQLASASLKPGPMNVELRAASPTQTLRVDVSGGSHEPVSLISRLNNSVPAASPTVSMFTPSGRIKAAPMSTFPSGEGVDLALLDPLSNEERSVSAVMVSSTHFGFPCFQLTEDGAECSLVGFYSERTTYVGEGTGALQFSPIRQFPQRMAATMQEEQTKRFIQLRALKSPLIFTLKDCATIASLKEQVLLANYNAQQQQQSAARAEEE